MSGVDTLRLCGFAILAAMCAAVVKKINASFDMPMRVAVAVVFFGMAFGMAVPLFKYVFELVSASVLAEWQGVLFGAVGVAFLTHLTAEMCRELGEGSLSGYIELAGKIEILILCLPLVGELLEEVEGLVG